MEDRKGEIYLEGEGKALPLQKKSGEFSFVFIIKRS